MRSPFRFPPAGSSEYKSPLVPLFGVLFLVVGSVLLLRVPYLFYQKSRLDDGLEVPAKILRVESVSSGRGRSSVSVEYEYRIHERVFKGNRASIFSESGDLYFRLRDAFESGREVTCFVDPKVPEFSALEKDVRALDLIGCVILGAPFTIFGWLYFRRFYGVTTGLRRHNKSVEASRRNTRR